MTDSPEAASLSGMNRRRPSLTINAIGSWVGMAVQLAVGFAITPLIIRYLGKFGFGLWTLVFSFAGYYGILNLGVRSAIMRYVARYGAQGDHRALNEVVSTALAMFCTTGAFVIGLSVFLAEPLSKFFKIDPAMHRDFVIIVIMVGFSAATEFILSVCMAILSAYEKYLFITCANSAAYIARGVLIAVMLSSGGTVVSMGIATLAMDAIMLVLNFTAIRWKIPEVQFTFKYARKTVLFTLLSYGSATAVVMAVILARTKLDSLIIARWLDIQSVAIYGIAAQIIHYVYNIVNVGIGVVTPRFARLDGIQRTEELKSLFFRSLFMCGFLAFGGGMMTIVFGPRVIRMWVGDSFAAAVPVLQILTVAYTAAMAQNSGYGLLIALNKHKPFARRILWEIVANVTLCILLAPRFGIVGVALGTAVPMLVIKLIVQPLHTAHAIGSSLREYLSPMAVPAAVGIGGTVVCFATGLYESLATIGFFPFLMTGAAIGVAYTAVVVFFSRKQHYFPKLFGLSSLVAFGIRRAKERV